MKKSRIPSALKRNISHSFISILAFLLLNLTGSSSEAQSVIERPNERVFNPPLKRDAQGRWGLKNPLKKTPRPPRIIAECEQEEIQYLIIKENGEKHALIVETLNGETTRVTKLENVANYKLSKEMLGQYAAALVLAQRLGLTEVDYVKIFTLKKPLSFEGAKELIFFYDSDDELIEKTFFDGKKWLRCLDSKNIPALWLSAEDIGPR